MNVPQTELTALSVLLFRNSLSFVSVELKSWTFDPGSYRPRRTKAFENTLRQKGEMFVYQYFLVFLQCLLPNEKHISSFKVSFILSSGHALNLVVSKILSFGKGLTTGKGTFAHTWEKEVLRSPEVKCICEYYRTISLLPQLIKTNKQLENRIILLCKLYAIKLCKVWAFSVQTIKQHRSQIRLHIRDYLISWYAVDTQPIIGFFAVLGSIRTHRSQFRLHIRDYLISWCAVDTQPIIGFFALLGSIRTHRSQVRLHIRDYLISWYAVDTQPIIGFFALLGSIRTHRSQIRLHIRDYLISWCAVDTQPIIGFFAVLGSIRTHRSQFRLHIRDYLIS